MLEPRDFMVPVVDVEFPVVEKKPVTDWSNFEALVPRPSVSIAGIYLEMRGRPSAPIIRHVMRREAHERTVTFNEQARLMGQLAKPKDRYVPPSEPSGSSSTNHHLAVSGFKQRNVPREGSSVQRVPQRPLPPLPCPPSDSSPTRRRSPNQGDEPLRQSSAKSGNEKRHLSAMDVAAQGISEVLWQDKGSSSGGMQGTAAKAISPDNWEAYYKQQRATMTSHQTFTWGGRYTFKGTDLDPQDRFNFQAGAHRRPLRFR